MVFALDISGSMTAEEMEPSAPRVECVLRKAVGPSGTLRRDVLWHEREDGAEVYFRTRQAGSRNRSHGARAKRTYQPILTMPSTMLFACWCVMRRARASGRLIKRAVLVVTDGFPVGDTVSAPTVIERANAAEASIYVVTLAFLFACVAGRSAKPTADAVGR